MSTYRRSGHEVLYDRLCEYVEKYSDLLDGRERDDFSAVIHIVDSMPERIENDRFGR